MAATDVTRGSVRADANGSSVGRAARRFATETKQAWLYVSILGAGYFISRGLAKSGSSEPYTDEPSDR